MSIQAIIFDLDETLIIDDEATHQALEQVGTYAHAQVGVDAGLLACTAYTYAQRLWVEGPVFQYSDMLGISASEGLWGRFEGGDSRLQALHDWAPSYQREAWRFALKQQNVDDENLAVRLAELFQARRYACQRLFPEAIAVLQALRRSYKLALLTNGAPDMQREKIKYFQLAPYFETIVVSGEVGVGKPQPAIFHTVLKQLEVAPQDAMMVGDSLERDIKGAYQSGLKSAWVNRRDLPCEPEYGSFVHTEIANLDELEHVL
ncbi:MAG TPA: HAD family hydrolase [Ktedonobacteraceae bacterium]|jgi:putative hydrolase of the HAD superfamily